MTIKQCVLATAIASALTAPAYAGLVISEYVEGSSNNKAIELLNIGTSDVDLTAWELQVFYNGSNAAGLTIDLDGSVAPNGAFVFAHSQSDPAILSAADQTTGSGLFNGDDAVLLLNGGVVADSIGQVGVDPGSYWGDTVRTQNQTLRRREGTDSDNNPDDAYEPAAVFDSFAVDSFDDLGNGADDGEEPGNPELPDMACGNPASLISDVQGTSDVSPLAGENLVVEAVVSVSFSGDDGLGGFYIEAEADQRDSNPDTSEGLFVYAPGETVTVGQRVRIAGEITEFGNLTELTNVADIAGCGMATLPSPVNLTLPWASANAPEAFESMRVRFNEPLIVNDNYDLGRFGSLTLGSGRHFIPTNVAEPGADAALVEELNTLDRLILDDGSNRQNPAVVPYPSPELSATATVRAGDTVNDLIGVLDYRFSEWRLQPLSAPSFAQSNPRTPSPELEDSGNLVVASFNVLNYFNGDGMGGGFPTARGADDAEELRRQTDKLVSAITELNADIVGLMEIENDGYGDNSAIAQLADSLGGNWSFVDSGMPQLGGDAIAVGFIYNTDRVETVGNAATLATAPFDDLNRQPLAQTFRASGSEDAVTIAVNHFKSKGCGSADGANAEQGDGQGCWNPVRTQASNALASWLASDPTGTAEDDVLIIGDLNSYAKEDPIRTLTDNGYTDLVAMTEGESAYSYVFFGQAGYLDHGLANTSLVPKVADTTVWHINADEPRALDYNTDFKTPEQQADFYAPDSYRASDHDPVIVALAMETDSLVNRADLNGDGKVNGRDVAQFILARLFGRATVEQYDLNNDGRVNYRDLLAILESKHRH